MMRWLCWILPLICLLSLACVDDDDDNDDNDDAADDDNDDDDDASPIDDDTIDDDTTDDDTGGYDDDDDDDDNYWEFANEAHVVKYAADGTLLWTKIFPELKFVDVQLDADENIYLMGNHLMHVVKLDPQGEELWRVETDHLLGRMRIDEAGNVYLASCHNEQARLTKIDADGQIVWQTDYTGGDDFPKQINDIVLAEDRIFAIGNVEQIDHFTDVLLLTFDYEGNLLDDSRKSSFGRFIDSGERLALDSTGNLIAAGPYRTNLAGAGNMFLTRYLADGEVDWFAEIDDVPLRETKYWDTPFNLMLDESDNIFLSGNLEREELLYPVVTKFSADGQQQWVGSFTDLPSPVVMALAVDGDQRLVVAGYTKVDYHPRDLFVSVLSSAGQRQWSTQWPSNGELRYITYAVTVDQADNIYVAGLLCNAGSASFLVKFDADGNLLWDNNYCPENDDMVVTYNFQTVVDAQSNIYAVGFSEVDLTDYDDDD